MCRERFTPRRPLQAACSLPCETTLAERLVAKRSKARAKAERLEDKARREKLKRLSQWRKEAQAAFNAYVRRRDSHLPCVSCGRSANWGGQWHASHLRSVGAASSIRFHLWNVHRACSICNNHLSGNLANYLPRLQELIGAERVAWLNEQNAPRRYSVEYLRRIKDVFSRKAKRKAASNAMSCPGL